MKGIVQAFLTCCLFSLLQARVVIREIPILKEQHIVCAGNLNDVLYKLCDGKFNTFYNGVSSGNNSDPIGIVDKCCKLSCSLDYMSQYCYGKPTDSNIMRSYERIKGNQTFHQNARMPKSSSILLNNEVRKKENLTEQLQRGNGKTKKPVYVECMYRSFAHYLLRHPRRLQRHRRGRVGDIKKESIQQTNQHEEGSATQHKFGGGTGKPNFFIGS